MEHAATQTVATPAGTMVRTLRELRVGHALSLGELAEKCGVEKGTLSRIERGRVVATHEELAAISAVFGRQLETRTLAVYEETGQ